MDHIITQFKLGLMQGRFAPGQRLPPEVELGRQFGVGRSTVREAVKVLAAMGVLRVRRGDGTFVSHGTDIRVLDPLLFAMLLEPQTPQHLFETRMAFEGTTARLAAVHATEQDFANIEATIVGLAAYAGSDADTLAGLDMAFHSAVLACTRNPLVIKIGTALNAMFFESVKRANLLQGGAQTTLRRHRIQLAALRSRDVAKIDKALAHSLKGWRKSIG